MRAVLKIGVPFWVHVQGYLTPPGTPKKGTPQGPQFRELPTCSETTWYDAEVGRQPGQLGGLKAPGFGWGRPPQVASDMQWRVS